MSYTELLLVAPAEAAPLQFSEPHQEDDLWLTREGNIQARILGDQLAAEGYSPEQRHSPRELHAPDQIRTHETLSIALSRLEHDRSPMITHKKELAAQRQGGHLRQYSSAQLAQLKEEGADFVPPGLDKWGRPGEAMSAVVHRAACYIASLRREVSPANSVMAVVPETTLRGLLSYLELTDGRLQERADPLRLQQRIKDAGKAAPCARSLLTIEGGPDIPDMRVRIKYAERLL